ncbi:MULTISPECIES: Tim44 domain-containing protein [unclassified Herbaspirillum]|uniref:Tim44 domain-containing protein n=1 Tax=unclassified Herbaspirillum TaxID=2624150 RepID=UPI00114EC23E|nr:MULTISPECIES: TIM44-like domain-containing protein [unclassified Herbaspirillum]MBB5392241.1 putative lipid-binding transport protein (Tim44 family) [Herbaspirillum sp. SJZ102]TQK05883.1 putative lipid-binding transport protein (Tim44 family) [Herbaspirillum sp. SJZ130]TQK12639.1 putative lipid-binding transport protein (Tim44 family) [Herbaspirillum sp. SJZ106]
MKKFLLVLMLALTSLTLVMSPADARRLGGGGSFGKQSSNYSRQAAPASPSYNAAPSAAPSRPATPAATPQGVPAKPSSPWGNILGGALLGFGLGALMSHFGIGGAAGGMLGSLLTIVLLAGAAFFLIRLFTRNRYEQSNNPVYATPMPGVSPIGSAAGATPEIGSGLKDINPPPGHAPVALQGNGFGSTAAQPAAPTRIEKWGIPDDFDTAGFVRNAKTYFIRLQAAWDRADINDIREFTTPEMFAELRMQLTERGASPNATDVVQLDAELLGIETMAYDYMATVRFQGLIKEAPELSAEPFAEIWNLSKPQSGGGWVLAGIQQV